VDFGASLGAFSAPADPEDLLPVRKCAPLVVLRPGKALAATSEKTAVSATEPAIIQRLARPSLRSAVSRAFE
jgi:hypothetical protein